MVDKNIKLKTLKCKKCKKVVENVGERATSVLCDDCTQKHLEEAIENQENETFINNENDIKLNKKEDKKMSEEKSTFGKATVVPCSICGEEKFTRQDVYDKRVAKFGSVEKMLAEYVCRKCKKAN